MRHTLIKHFHNIRKAEKVRWETPKSICQRYGMYDFDNYTVFERNGFTFRIFLEDAILWWHHGVTIKVDGIKVYEDGWIHNTPIRMKNEIKETVKEIKQINREWENNKLSTVYNKFNKKKKKDEKQERVRLFEDEKKRLHEKYANRENE